jgi:hypothetical protein
VRETRQRRVEDLVTGGPAPDGRVDRGFARFDAIVRHAAGERYNPIGLPESGRHDQAGG